MEYRNLGRSGLKVSTVGLGCNNFGWTIGLEDSRAVIDAAIDAGITFFDALISASWPSRWSGTLATPTLGSVVAKAYGAARAPPPAREL